MVLVSRLVVSTGVGTDPSNRSRPFDQFNSLHERLIEAWGRVRRELGGRVVFAAMRRLARRRDDRHLFARHGTQAGLKTEFLAVKDIGWHAGRRVFTDLRERTIEVLFKLYPWEWILREPFGRFLPSRADPLAGAPWKMVLSNKAILPVLHELFPESPYLLHGFEPIGKTYVIKPIYSREGANVTIVEDGQTIAETGGDYSEGRLVYQEFCPLPSFNGRYPVIGSWIVNGHACGMGIREDDGLITRNTSRFLPHIFRKSAGAKPPVMNPKGFSGQDEGPRLPARTNDPLWDPWLDR